MPKNKKPVESDSDSDSGPDDVSFNSIYYNIRCLNS